MAQRPSWRCGFYDNGIKFSWFITGPGIQESGFEDTADQASETLENTLATLRRAGRFQGLVK